MSAASQTAKVVKSSKVSNRGSKPGERRGGRQKGIPNKATVEVREIARAYGPEAIEAAAKLAGLVKNKVGAVEGRASSEQAQIAALGIILDRAYGRPTQTIAGDEERPLHVMNHILDFLDGSSRGLASGTNGKDQDYPRRSALAS